MSTRENKRRHSGRELGGVEPGVQKIEFRGHGGELGIGGCGFQRRLQCSELRDDLLLHGIRDSGGAGTVTDQSC